MSLDCLFLYVPKMNNFYKLYGHHIYGMFMPMGLFAIADFINQNGYKVQILHLGIEKINKPRFSLKEYLSEIKPKIVGLSLHWSLQSFDAIKAAKEIKSFDSNIFVVAGGFMASFFHQEIMENFDCIDGIVRGDGELPFLRLTERLFDNDSNLANIPNLVWRKNGKIIKNDLTYIASSQDLDRFNFTNFELIKNSLLYIKYASHPWIWIKGFSKKLNIKIHRKRIFPLSVFRGCPVICSYCGGNRMAQKMIYGRTEISIRSVEKVIYSISEAKRCDYDTIYIPYLQFKDRPFYFQELFEKIKENKIEINAFLECWTLPTKEILEMFKKTFLSTHSRILISPECALEKVRYLNKTCNYTNQYLNEVLQWTNEFQIPVELFFTIGLPFETLTDMKIIKDFQASLKKQFNNVIIRTNHFELEPATPMYLDPGKYRIIKNRNSFLDFYKINNPRIKHVDYGLGYCNLIFSSDKKCNEINVYTRQIQSAQCRYFCLLSDFLSDFIKLNHSRINNKIVRIFSRIICRVFSFYWRLNKIWLKNDLKIHIIE